MDGPSGDPLRVTLKIGESVRAIQVPSGDTIAEVKAREFPNTRVRFLCRGKELRDESLVSVAKADVSLPGEAQSDIVIHCVVQPRNLNPINEEVGTHRAATGTGEGNTDDFGIDSCKLLQIVLGVCGLSFWMIYFSAPELFERSSVVMLFSITIAYLLFIATFTGEFRSS